ncbi:MAG TPA: sigma-54 dependent transcriptional regulator [Terriglobales bacterium]|jgi:two-component system response regulator PilR (NtrC family)|nr:sigma-54 dependent transcriptional regulator [Terriglobales bacterium]
MGNDDNGNSGPECRIAIITGETGAFPDMQHCLSPRFSATLAQTEKQIQAAVDDISVRAILIDLDSVGTNQSQATQLLQDLRQVREDLVLVAVTRSNSRSIPLKASQAGADEFFLAPLDFQELQIVLWRAIEKRRLQLEGQRLIDQAESKTSFCGLIGVSETMQRVYQAIQAVADSNTTVILRGESGTGKELIAGAIVQLSSRRDKPYVCLNCSAIPENLVESELFGHEKGAFTGADSPKPGLIESAHGGTLFLDEITTLDHGLQSKLLRVLQERTVQRVGGRSSKKINFRLIAATNDNLEELVRQGRFREDLYYRINVVPIFIPPLRERPGDLPLLVDHFLRIYCAANNRPLKQLEPEALEIMEDYSWPGNVRELENVIQRLIIMSNSPVIRASHLPQPVLYSSAASQEAILIPEDGVDFDGEMERIELAYLTAALNRTRGRKAAAAALLRIDPQRMKYLCRKRKLAAAQG